MGVIVYEIKLITLVQIQEKPFFTYGKCVSLLEDYPSKLKFYLSLHDNRCPLFCVDTVTNVGLLLIDQQPKLKENPVRLPDGCR